MKKAITLPAPAGKTTSAGPADGKTEFRIRPGVEWINGRRVTGEKTVRLTPEESSYDLGLSRIAPVGQPIPADWPSEILAGGDGDGGD